MCLLVWTAVTNPYPTQQFRMQAPCRRYDPAKSTCTDDRGLSKGIRQSSDGSCVTPPDHPQGRVMVYFGSLSKSGGGGARRRLRKYISRVNQVTSEFCLRSCKTINRVLVRPKPILISRIGRSVGGGTGRTKKEFVGTRSRINISGAVGSSH